MSDFDETKLVIAISSRALFDLEESHVVYENQGLDAYRHYQIKNENSILAPGRAFSLVKKFLDINEYLSNSVIEVILLSRNSADTGLRVFSSINEHNLAIKKAAFCGGESPIEYASSFNCHLFLSTSYDDVRDALNRGVGAAQIFPKKDGVIENLTHDSKPLKIAFDGDAVLFSDEAERIFQNHGLDVFVDKEQKASHKPLPGGPLKPFLFMLNKIQTECNNHCPIRTALVTARSAPAHERVIRTLRSWNVRLDEALFLGGEKKGPFLKAFDADIFFDDQYSHCQSAEKEDITSGHVIQGIKNKS